MKPTLLVLLVLASCSSNKPTEITEQVTEICYDKQPHQRLSKTSNQTDLTTLNKELKEVQDAMKKATSPETWIELRDKEKSLKEQIKSIKQVSVK